MSKLKILVIDDKKIIGDLFEFTLGCQGYDIRWVNNADEALVMVKSQDFDIVFLDIVIPKRDGVSILKEIKEIVPELPVVMMSGYSVEEKQIQAKEFGAITCLKKPFEMDEVREIIKQAVGRDV